MTKNKIIKRIILAIIIIALVIYLGSIAIHWFTWGGGPELKNAELLATEYLHKKYSEEIEVVASNRFLRGDYHVICSLLSDDNLSFTVTISSDMQNFSDNYFAQKVAQDIQNELTDGIKSYYLNAYVTVGSEIDYDLYKFSKQTSITESQIQKAVDGSLRISIFDSFPLNATNYEAELNNLCNTILVVQQYKYRPNNLWIFPEGYPGYEDYNAGKTPLLLLKFEKEDFISITSPDDLIPFIKKAISDNPYYDNMEDES